jgi:hypothetical protein
MAFEIPNARTLAQEAKIISRARSSERRDCASYSLCFDKAAYSNRMAVPCKTCKKFRAALSDKESQC